MDTRRHHVVAAVAAFVLGVCAPAAAQTQGRPTPPRGPVVVVPVPGYVQVYPDQSFEFHGALAYDRQTARVGFSYDWATAREADVEALKQCGEPQCVVMASYRSACGALAVGARGPFAALGATRAEAETRALAACADTASCTIQAWSCTR